MRTGRKLLAALLCSLLALPCRGAAGSLAPVPEGYEAQWAQTAYARLRPQLEADAPGASLLQRPELLLPALARLADSVQSDAAAAAPEADPVASAVRLHARLARIADILTVLEPYRSRAPPALLEALSREQAAASRSLARLGGQLVARRLADKAGAAWFGRSQVLALDPADGAVLEAPAPDASRLKGPLLVLKHARDEETEAVFGHEARAMAAADRLGLPVPLPLTLGALDGRPYLAYLVPQGALAADWWGYYGDRLPGNPGRKESLAILERESRRAIDYMLELGRHGWRQGSYAAITHGVPYDWSYVLGREDGSIENTSLHNALSGLRYGNVRREGIHADFASVLPLAPPLTPERVRQVGQGLSELALLTLRAGEENGVSPEETARLLSSMLERYARGTVPETARVEMSLPRLQEAALATARSFHDYWTRARAPSPWSRLLFRLRDLAVRAVSLQVTNAEEDVIMDGAVISPLVLDGIRPLAEAAAGFQPSPVIGLSAGLRRFAYFLWASWPNELGLGKPGAFLSAGLILASLTAAVQAPGPEHFLAAAAAALLQAATAWGRFQRHHRERRARLAAGPWIRLSDPGAPPSAFASSGELFPPMTRRGVLYSGAVFSALAAALAYVLLVA